jgi:SdrD B-like protein
MSKEVHTTLQEKTQGLLQGPLKHIRGAALAAALLPLASIAATPASAQTVCASGGVCGTVFNDTNNDGIQQVGEPPIEGVKITVCQLCNGTDDITTETGPTGSFFVDVPGATYTVAALIPTGTQASPPNVGDDSFDSDGVPNGGGFSIATSPGNGTATDFGFHTPPTAQPGTGTPGYWKNHPDAWPVTSIKVGAITYSEADAIMLLGKTGKDKSITMFQSLVSAMLSADAGNDSTCVTTAIAQGNAWLVSYPPGSNVAGGSAAWTLGDPIHITLDAYDNGLLCAPHRK